MRIILSYLSFLWTKKFSKILRILPVNCFPHFEMKILLNPIDKLKEHKLAILRVWFLSVEYKIKTDLLQRQLLLQLLGYPMDGICVNRFI